MNKPLEKWEREFALIILRKFGPECERTIQALLEAEAYWREAVKNAKAFSDVQDFGECPFCARDIRPVSGSETREGHATDCPWLLAQ